MSLISKESKKKATEAKDAATKELEAKAKDTTATTTAVVPAGDRPVAKITTSKAFISNEAVVEAVSEMNGGDLPTIYASDGTHMANGEDIGKEFEYFAISQYPLWKVEPGDTSDDAKDYKVSSFDGEVDRDGVPLADTLEECIEAGYPKAKIKEYICVMVYVTKYDDTNIDLDDGFALFRISPASQWGKGGYRKIDKSMKLKAALGKLKAVPVEGLDCDAVKFKATAELAKFEGNSFTKSVVTLA